jgi:hypothetical protein
MTTAIEHRRNEARRFAANAREWKLKHDNSTDPDTRDIAWYQWMHWTQKALAQLTRMQDEIEAEIRAVRGDAPHTLGIRETV